jgi:serine phosphatase RsbU (regulator of sigma subunit)
MPRISILFQKIIATIFLYICLPLSPCLAMEPVIIDDTLTYKVIGRYIDYFEDSKKTITFADIISDQKTQQLPWVRSREDKPGFGYKDSVYWTRILIMNSGRKDIDFYLYLEFPLIDKLNLYVADNNGKYSEIETGAMYPFAQRPYEYKNFVFPVTVKGGMSGIMYLRLDSRGSKNIHLSVVTPDTFEEIKDTDAIFFWIFYGIFLVMTIFNLFIFLVTRERSYLYYILYLVSFALLTMTLNGMAYQYLWPGNSMIGKLPIPIAMSIIVISIIQFARTFIIIRNFSIICDNILKALVLIAFIMLMIMLSTRDYLYSVKAANILTGVAAIVVTLLTGYVAVFKKSRQAQLFTGTFLFFSIGVILTILQYRGIIPATLLTVNGIHMGAVFQVITLSLGLAYKINSMKNELESLNRELEGKVGERTADLRAANEEMTIMNKELLKASDELWAEMQFAKKIQTILLPENPGIPGYEVSAYMQPADDVGGDYYDIINAGGMDWIIIGDVSGHGIPAGLIMMMAQTSINTILRDQPGLSPSEVLIKINRTLFRNIQKLGEDKYMTITVLAAHKNGAFFFSGLHQDIMLYRNYNREVELLDTDGIWIGIMGDIGGSLADQSFEMHAGDTMLLYTDGITEAWEKGTTQDFRDPGHQMFGPNRLRDTFREMGDQPLEAIKTGIIGALENYDCSDDVTIVIIRRVS